MVQSSGFRVHLVEMVPHVDDSGAGLGQLRKNVEENADSLLLSVYDGHVECTAGEVNKGVNKHE